MADTQFWAGALFWLHASAAFLSAALAIWLWHKGIRSGAPRVMLVPALAVTSFWALAVAVEGNDNSVAVFAETVRNFAWLGFMYGLLRTDGRNKQPRSVSAIYGVLVSVLCVQIVVDALFQIYADIGGTGQLLFYSGIVMRLLLATGMLVLVHNLYTMSFVSAQPRMKLQIGALAALWGYDLNLYTVAYLASQISTELFALRGAAMTGVICFFAYATHRGDVPKIHVSRSMAFQSLSLIAIGSYLAVMVLVAQALQIIGGDYARLAQISIVFGMSIAALCFLPSARYRAWFKVKVAKHLFQHRYDYRAEWMRFTDTIGRPGDDAAPFHKRVIQAVADIPESSAGLLLTPNEHGRLELQARWNWPTIKVPATACNSSTIPYFENTEDIVELTQLRAGKDDHCDAGAIPQWLVEEESAWAIVPLVHFNRLAGIVVLSRPSFTRMLDWEDFDMLRVVGRQVASYLAEQKGQEALLQSRQFDEFNRRFAFVMHDIKNIVSQLTLVARNAQRHADNPEFRKDMIETLGGSVNRMNTMLARFSQYGRSQRSEIGEIDPADIIGRVVKARSCGHEIEYIGNGTVTVLASAENLEQVIGHLLQNAIDASAAGNPVVLKSYRDGPYGCIEIADSGSGMTAEFVRSSLFKPFVSSKNDGFGIGAYEARTLVEAMHGQIEVETHPGHGTRFTVRLPLANGKISLAEHNKEEAA